MSKRDKGAGTRRWCFADQLGPHFLDDPDQPVLLIESRAHPSRPQAVGMRVECESCGAEGSHRRIHT
ncbi:MAG: hypothetical protein ACLPXZ_12955, partial [Mycobacterium sp.]